MIWSPANALLRPGPLDAGMHPVFIRRKLGQEPVRYPTPRSRDPGAHLRRHPYQEQVMRIATCSPDLTSPKPTCCERRWARRIGAGQQEVAKFVERAVPRDMRSGMIEELGRPDRHLRPLRFNKSHSVAYRSCRYQTAWLKAHYPAEFMAALLSSEIGNTDKVVRYINEARELDWRSCHPM